MVRLPIAKGAPASPGATSGTLDVSSSHHYGKSVTLTFPLVPNACLANVCELRAIFDNDGPQVLPYDDISSHGVTVRLLAEEYTKFLAATVGLTPWLRPGDPGTRDARTGHPE